MLSICRAKQKQTIQACFQVLANLSRALAAHFFLQSWNFWNIICLDIMRRIHYNAWYVCCVSKICFVLSQQVSNTLFAYHALACSGMHKICKNPSKISRFKHFIFLNSVEKLWKQCPLRASHFIGQPFRPQHHQRVMHCIICRIVSVTWFNFGHTCRGLVKTTTARPLIQNEYFCLVKKM